ncbi:B-cell lymphoma/leukemia 11A-like [Physella acuta]|uniref:B-cell lymphoma/leukemia 11A-like n=1 Tax=Physella acuta TaxID=109671 RepID=UPI0027DD86D1|nr:B-cell lymphoma/leukemia 11A-like [Physella acuta]
MGTSKSLALLRTLYAYLERVEKENDLLVCGDCQTSFALQDIVLFIKHKKQCCDKENVDTADGPCRKPGSGGGINNNEHNGDHIDDDDPDEDNDDEGVDVSKSSSRRGEDEEEEDEASEDNNKDENGEEDSMDTSGHNSLVNGEAVERHEQRRRREDRTSRTPLRQKQVADAESNTIHSEPSRFVCETCRSTYTSAWALLQHAQKEHGMKIYTNSSNHSPSAASTPVPISPIDLVVASSPRSGMDHRSVSSSGSGGSASPFPVHAPNPFASPFTRMPHPTSLSPFSRGNFDFDIITDYRLRPQLYPRGSSGLDHQTFTSYDRTRAHLSPAFESNYDYYSMRLKQLASSPVVSKSQFTSSQPPNIAATPNSSKPESPSLEASSPRSSSLSTAAGLAPKLKSCEFCGKSFRFQSNLVVHRRSHTGEKPYKCSICPHACTQQSKLKRHMKTHATKTEEGATSPSGAIHPKEEEEEAEEGDEEEEEEEDDEEEEEEEDEEMDDNDMGEEEMNDEEREVLEKLKKAANGNEETTPEPGEIRHVAKKIKLESDARDDLPGARDELPNDLSLKAKPVESLLSEVMKNSGLNNIQTYSEAFKAALAESQENSKDKVEDRNSRDSQDSANSDSPKSPRTGVKRELELEKDSEKSGQKDHLFLGGTDLLSKSLKRDWATSVDTLSRGMDPAAASLYRSTYPWYHPDNPVRLFFPSYPPRFSQDLNLNPEAHNGLNLSPGVATTSSALKTDSPSIPSLFKPNLASPPNYPSSHRRGTSSSSSSPTGNLLMPSNGSGLNTPPRKENRRNDTCEFCGKVFKNCSNLTVHRRSHTGEKPYKCSLCSYACAQSSKLTRHMKTHGRLGKDVYTCKFCNMPFSVPSTLEKHMRKCVENRNARLLTSESGDLSSESNGEMSLQSDAASGVY